MGTLFPSRPYSPRRSRSVTQVGTPSIRCAEYSRNTANSARSTTRGSNWTICASRNPLTRFATLSHCPRHRAEAVAARVSLKETTRYITACRHTRRALGKDRVEREVDKLLVIDRREVRPGSPGSSS